MTLESVSARLWANRLKREPVGASLMGFHEHDSELDDLSDKSLDSNAAELRDIAADALAIDAGPLDAQDRITRDLIIHESEVSAEALEGRYMVTAVDTYVGPPSSLILAVNSLKATSDEESEAYAERWKKVPDFLEQALHHNLAGIEMGRPPVGVVAGHVLDGIDGYLGTAIEEDPFYKATIHDDCSEEFRSEVAAVVVEHVRPAYTRYRDAVREQVMPVARPDTEPGLCYTRDGAEVYPKLIHQYTSIEADPQELHDYGLHDATQKLPEEWAEIGERALGISDLPVLFDRLRNDPALAYGSSDEMVAHAEATVERAWAAIDGWLGARPESPCEVRAVPSSIAKDLPPAFYFTPSEDGTRPGIYFINTYEPSTRQRYMYESIHFHEAIPGHHFDRSLAMELKGLPEFRRHFPSFAQAEGWGLYAERLADEMGLYSTDMDRLGMLATDAWRAGRLVVDTGLHAMGWSRQQAIDWFAEWTPVPLPVIEQEVDRYIGMPGQALAYKSGQKEIFRLRALAEDQLGDRFDIVAFHDTVLTSGGMTLPLLAGVVEDWIQSAG